MENTEFIQPSSLPFDLISDNKKVDSKIEINKMGENLQSTIDEVEKMKLKEFLSIYGDTTESKKIIAKKLNVSLSTLYRKLKKIDC
jgi:transcriptional regulator with PAS, ATPase and Fis domain